MTGLSEYLQECWADLLEVLDRIAAALEKLADAEDSEEAALVEALKRVTPFLDGISLSLPEDEVAAQACAIVREALSTKGDA